jgi:hypothetical protein
MDSPGIEFCEWLPSIVTKLLSSAKADSVCPTLHFPALTCGANQVPPLRGWYLDRPTVSPLRGWYLDRPTVPPLHGWCNDRTTVPPLRGWCKDRPPAALGIEVRNRAY